MIGNGVNGSTGRYLTDEDRGVDQAYSEAMLDPALERHFQWIQERAGDIDPERLPKYGVNVKALGSAGWGAIFGRNVGSEVREALTPLLKLRDSQAGGLYKTLPDYAGENKFQ